MTSQQALREKYSERKNKPRSLFSHSHHQVETDGVLWYKSPDPHSAYAKEKIQREAIVLDILGYPYIYENETIVSPSHGEPVPTVNAEMLREMISQLKNLPHVPSSVLDLVGSSYDLESRVRQNIDSRIGRECPDLSKSLMEIIPTCPAPQPYVLSHTDPHVGNWVKKDEKLTLIDWESAVNGFLELDLAALWNSTFSLGEEEGRTEELRAIVYSSIRDERAFDWALRMKVSTALSYRAWKRGEEDAWDHLRALRENYPL